MSIKQINDSEVGYFYVDGYMCYDSVCVTHPFDWVRAFDVAQNGSSIIVLQKDAGLQPAGVYARIGNGTAGGISKFQWRFVIPYADFKRHCSAINSQVKIYTNVSAPIETGVRDHVYRNGHFVGDGAQIMPSSFDFWAQIIPLESDADKAVTKDDGAATNDIIQISDGKRKIKDWTPPKGGIVKTDATGRPSIAEPGVDYSLPVDLQKKNLVPADAVWGSSDPSIELTVGGVVQRKIKIAELRSGGGFLLGNLIVDFE